MAVFLPDSIRDIRLFVAVYEERSFTAAASRQNATQSGVSQHIIKIEGRLGVKLFYRDSGAVIPTPAGDQFYSSCVQLLASLDDARRRLERFEDEVSGSITLGITPTVARSVVSPAISRFINDYPNANIKVVEGYSAHIVDSVKAGTLDFGVVPGFPNEQGVRSRLFAETLEVFVSGAGNPQEWPDPLHLSEMPPLKLVLPSTTQARRRNVDKYLAIAGARIERIIEMDSMFGTLDFVANTDWVTILPSIMMLRDFESSRFRINALGADGLLLELVMIESTQKPVSTLATIFFEYLEKETAHALDAVDSLLAGKQAQSPHRVTSAVSLSMP